MKTKIFFSLAFFAFFSAVSAQTFLTQVKPLDSSTWGYANSKGEIVIPAQYYKCYKFSNEGFAPIYDTQKRQYHFIDTKGQILTTEISGFKLQDAFGIDISGFKDGLVPVRVGLKWGYMNTSGQLAIEAKYDEVTEFNEGYASAVLDGKSVVLDLKGTAISVDITERIVMKEFSEKYAIFRAADWRLGFIGTDGKVAIPARYESVGHFSGGLAWAKDENRKLGYINSKGEWMIKPQYNGGKDFDKESGFARVKEGDQWFYISKTGEVLKVDTETYGDFCNGLAEGKKDGKVGFFNTKGEWVITPQFEGVRDFKNGFAAAKLNGKWGFIDTQGNWIVLPQFANVKDLELIK